MRRLPPRVSLFLAAAALPLSVFGPAAAIPATGPDAAGELAVSVPDVLLTGPACVDHAYGYSVTPDPAYASRWALSTDLYRPDGTSVTVGRVVNSPTGPAAVNGAHTLFVCGNLEKPGTYTAKNMFSYETRTTMAKAYLDVPVTVRYPTTTTALSVPAKAPFGKKVSAVVTVAKEATATVFAPAPAGVKVSLQVAKKGKWQTIATKKTAAGGVVKVTFKSPVKGKVSYRALTANAPYQVGSTSALAARKG